MGPLYQSANQYASLYFLREIAGVQAFLVNVYFVGDPISPTTTKEVWEAAIRRVDQELGIVREVPHRAAVFLTAE
jgi:hypothetical protein